MEQRGLLFRCEHKDVSNEIVFRLRTFEDALKVCKEISGLTDQQICQEIDMDPAQWSRIWSRKANFPHNKLVTFMEICKNLVPLRWMNHRFGMEAKPTKTLLELEVEMLKKELAEKDTRLKVIEDWERQKRGFGERPKGEK